jgi:hypothetical protein
LSQRVRRLQNFSQAIPSLSRVEHSVVGDVIPAAGLRQESSADVAKAIRHQLSHALLADFVRALQRIRRLARAIA